MASYLMELRGLVGRRLLLVPSVAAVIQDGDGRLLLQEKASGEGWSLPAGAIEPGETPQEAIMREVLEETGLKAAPVEILGSSAGGTSAIPIRAATRSICRHPVQMRGGRGGWNLDGPGNPVPSLFHAGHAAAPDAALSSLGAVPEV